MIAVIKKKLKKIYNDFIDNQIMKRRKERILRENGYICYCPKCKDPLNDHATCKDENFVIYLCSKCEYESIWSFDLAPVPIMLSYHKEKDQ